MGKLYDNLLKSVKREVSFITYISIMKLVRSSVSIYSDSVKSRHANKISHLSRHKILDVSGLDSSKIVVNLSSLKLSNTDVNILSRGLAYSVAPQQLDSVDIRTSFETFYRQLLSVLPTHCLWIFDIRISNDHLTSSQMDIQYSNIKRPSDDLPDGYSIFEYQTSI